MEWGLLNTAHVKSTFSLQKLHPWFWWNIGSSRCLSNPQFCHLNLPSPICGSPSQLNILNYQVRFVSLEVPYVPVEFPYFSWFNRLTSFNHQPRSSILALKSLTGCIFFEMFQESSTSSAKLLETGRRNRGLFLVGSTWRDMAGLQLNKPKSL